jgi:putative transposase
MRHAGLRGLAALPRRTRTTDSRHGYPIAPNRLGRNFATQTPNQIWLADLTYIPTGEGWLYLATVLDLHTRKIVGWSMRPSLHVEIALDALEMAIQRQRPAHGLIHHSDRGSQYLAIRYTERLADTGAVNSVGSKGDSYDNALAETIIGLYKAELVRNRGPWRGLDDLELATLEWVDWFNHRRLFEAHGQIPPAEFEENYYRQRASGQQAAAQTKQPA